MTTLYACKAEIDREGNTSFRLTKFDSFMNVEASYITSPAACTCPAGERSTCRHRQMLPKFIARGAVNTHWLYDHDRDGWVQSELSEALGEVERELDVPVDENGLELEVEDDDAEIVFEEERELSEGAGEAEISYPVSEEDCPGHAASVEDNKVCRYCGVHIDSLRPDDPLEAMFDGLSTIPGVTVFDLSQTGPETLFNAIADAVGEPRLEPQAPKLNRRGF